MMDLFPPLSCPRTVPVGQVNHHAPNKTDSQLKRSLGGCSAEPCQSGSFWKDLLSRAKVAGTVPAAPAQTRSCSLGWCLAHQHALFREPQPQPCMGDQHSPPGSELSQAASQSTSCLPWAAKEKDLGLPTPPVQCWMCCTKRQPSTRDEIQREH